MIEKIVLDYLTKTMGIQVFTEKEADMPKEYFMVEKTGSSKDDHIKQATIAVQSYAASAYKAAMLNEKLKEVMENMVEINDVSRCSLNSDYPYHDADKKEYRYQAVFDITYF